MIEALPSGPVDRKPSRMKPAWAMEENARKYPLKTFDIKHILEDGNLVAIHSHVKLKPDHPGVALIHIFRFEVGKIMELWDFGQAVPEDGVNENGMF